MNILSLAALAGAVIQQIKNLSSKIDKLEKKQDRHNSLVTRLTVVENIANDAHVRLDKHEEHTIKFIPKDYKDT